VIALSFRIPKRVWTNLPINLILITGAIAMLFPIFWMFSIALKPANEIFTPTPQLLPRQVAWGNFAIGWERSHFSSYFFNSLIVALGAVAFSVLFNSMAGFGFAKYRFRGRDALFLLILSALMIPEQVKIVPLYLLMVKIGWVNTFQGLIIPVISQAFGVFLMRQYMTTIPDDLLEAARIDGASEWRIFWQVALPLCVPAIATNTIFQFMWRWNALLWPLIVTRNEKMYTVQLGLALFQADTSVAGGPIMAMALISIIPIVVIFVLLQRYFIQGIALTGLKD
jgi:multiple sugar transport system permease protein/alpha-1,4-digalacturonate transport system permease protein